VPSHNDVSRFCARTLAVVAIVSSAAVIGCSREASNGAPAAVTQVVAPDSFDVTFQTTRGEVVVRARRDWAPRGVDRLYALVQNGFYDDTRFFRVLDGFMAQFGASGSPDVARSWSDSTIADDSVAHSNQRGRVSFASAGPNSRTTQLFISTDDNARLDDMGFAPVGEVVTGMAVVDSLHSGYGEGPPGGQGPDQSRITREGNAYLDREFPRLDAVQRATISREWRGGA
jgi:peptidyl-prolyl cis-trans isomerase A (cyclophilin A)